MTDIAAGTDYYQRLGRSITLVRMIWHLDCNLVAAAGGGAANTTFDAPKIRVVLAYDKQPALAQQWAEDTIPPTGALAIMNTNTMGATSNLLATKHLFTNKTRYEHLHDKEIHANLQGAISTASANQWASQGSIQHRADINLHGQKTIWYAPATTSIMRGQVLMWVMADSGLSALWTTGMNWSCQLFFMDDSS